VKIFRYSLYNEYLKILLYGWVKHPTVKQNMTKNKYPKGMHFYVLKDEGMYKIGYTKDLTK